MIHLRFVRLRLLIELDKEYPGRLDAMTLRALLDKEHGLNLIKRELRYLNEKGLISLRWKKREVPSSSISARGRDFLAGDVSEVGIESASSLHYTGPDDVR